MKAKLRRVALAVLAACPPAYAEQAVPGERIEVTGSRLPSSDVESTSPVAVIRAEDIRLEGFQSIELVLNNFPQFTADQGTRISNGATGTATANLRALGAERTLVLLNGKRMPAGSPFTLAPDLNQVPMALIQRV
jgi:outer membrane cobalamin receptor